MRTRRVRALLMGGQACVFYGAAGFGRDIDFAILADSANLVRLSKALDDLQAEPIAVPPFDIVHLRHGHAIHFRCQHPEALRMRVDVISKMRGVNSFNKLCKTPHHAATCQRRKVRSAFAARLVQAKKTRSDKDWPMIRRLLEAHYFQNQPHPTLPQIRFWFQELRTPQLLMELTRRYPAICRRIISKRPLLEHAESGAEESLQQALVAEETAERQRDKQYWLQLRRDLEKLRHDR